MPLLPVRERCGLAINLEFFLDTSPSSFRASSLALSFTICPLLLLVDSLVVELCSALSCSMLLYVSAFLVGYCGALIDFISYPKGNFLVRFMVVGSFKSNGLTRCTIPLHIIYHRYYRLSYLGVFGSLCQTGYN